MGTSYHGFQIQQNALTVQEVFQSALYKLCPEKPAIKGCSRTDAGVHARKFCISFRYSGQLNLARIITALNHLLPEDIRVLDGREVPDDFHARYSSLGKRYVYRIVNRPVMDPFENGFALHVPEYFDMERMNEVARLFVGEHDFAAFTGNKNTQEDTVRTIYRSEFVPDLNGNVRYIVEGNGFLYNMVRILVGTQLNYLKGRVSISDIQKALDSGERTRFMPTAPAHALYLDEVFYDFGE